MPCLLKRFHGTDFCGFLPRRLPKADRRRQLVRRGGLVGVGEARQGRLRPGRRHRAALQEPELPPLPRRRRHRPRLGDGAEGRLRPPRRQTRCGAARGPQDQEVRADLRRDRLHLQGGRRRAVRRVLRRPERLPQAHLRGWRPRSVERRLHLLVALEHDPHRADGRVCDGDGGRLYDIERDRL